MTKTKLSGHEFGKNWTASGIHHIAIRPWMGLGSTGLVIEVWRDETHFDEVYLGKMGSDDLTQAITDMAFDIESIEGALHVARTKDAA